MEMDLESVVIRVDVGFSDVTFNDTLFFDIIEFLKLSYYQKEDAL